MVLFKRTPQQFLITIINRLFAQKILLNARQLGFYDLISFDSSQIIRILTFL